MNKSFMHQTAQRSRLFVFVCLYARERPNGRVTQQMDKCPFLIYRPREQDWQRHCDSVGGAEPEEAVGSEEAAQDTRHDPCQHQ